MATPFFPRIRPGATPTAADFNALADALAAMQFGGQAGGDLGVARSLGGMQLLDGREKSHWAKIGARGTGANYAHTSVAPDGDGTWTDLANVPEYPWGTATDQPAREVNGSEDVESGAYVRLWPDPNGNGWLFDAGGSAGGGACCPASGGGGLASLLSLSKGACVEVVGFGGVGRCENLEAFDAIVAKWSPGDAAWVTAAADAVTTPLGDTVFHYWVASETPRLKAVGEDGEVEFKFNGSDGTYLWFITRSPLLCTDPPGGPCVPNVWTVRLRCVECGESVSCAPQSVCVVPPDCLNVGGLCELSGTITAEAGFVIDGIGFDCPWSSSFSNWEITAPCVGGVVDFSQAAIAWTTDPGGLSGTLYPDVQVVSEVPLHLRVFVDFAGTSLGALLCGAAGEVTFDVWPAPPDDASEPCGEPTTVVADCSECAGGAPFAWMADLSGLPTADYFGDLDAWNHGGTVEAGSAGYWWNDGGSCVWIGWNAGEGAYATTTVTVGATTVTLDIDGVIYVAAKGADCCGPYTLALDDIGTFPGDPDTLPATITLVAFGDCTTSPPPPPPATSCDGAATPLRLVIDSTAPELDGSDTTITKSGATWTGGTIAGCGGGGFILSCTGDPAAWSATFNGCALVLVDSTDDPDPFTLTFELQAGPCGDCTISPDGEVPVGTTFVVSVPP